MSTYTFGVEIEVVALPHKEHYPFSYHLYYTKLADALQKRGEPALADSLEEGYRKHPEHYHKWWITWDGSLTKPTMPAKPAVLFEAVSPVMRSSESWEERIDTFWEAYSKVFHMPEKLKRCGSHIHMSQPGGFSLKGLKRIAWCTVRHEDSVVELLPKERRDHRYAQPNTLTSTALLGETLKAMGKLIDKCKKKADLIEIMQGSGHKDRYVLWNWANIVKASGTVEFRGGRCLRGRVRTKRWIAFATAFVHFSLEKDQDEWRDEAKRAPPSPSELECGEFDTSSRGDTDENDFDDDDFDNDGFGKEDFHNDDFDKNCSDKDDSDSDDLGDDDSDSDDLDDDDPDSYDSDSDDDDDDDDDYDDFDDDYI